MPPIPRSSRPADLLFPGGAAGLAPPGQTRPASPFRMAPRIDAALADRDLARFVPATTRLKDGTRESSLTAAFGDDRHALRALAGEIRRQTLGALDHHLAAFAQQAEAHGLHLHVAADAAQARAIVLDLIAKTTADLPPDVPRRIVKAKSMVTEEIQLLDALLSAGHDALETDLGELVLQLDDDAPSHLVTPMIHKDRQAAARALVRLGAAPDAPPTILPPDPTTLTKHARHHLRAAFRDAHVGITGANFLVAETGEIVLCTNEGNGRLSALAGRAHIAVTGIEKVVPTLAQLGVFLELLARSATGQPLTVYTSFVAGPFRASPISSDPAPSDPAREVHLVLVDNGRSRVLASDTVRAALACIRCGACLNACPVYRTIGGHAFGSVWPGPIGMVLTPLMRGP
ncbi:MAG: lactate utilization protein, partial [Deltaproteobacteria bacterium]|nr:lactate utilization protein [Deltaproteobacteria bacterium]